MVFTVPGAYLMTVLSFGAKFSVRRSYIFAARMALPSPCLALETAFGNCQDTFVSWPGVSFRSDPGKKGVSSARCVPCSPSVLPQNFIRNVDNIH